MVYITAKKIGVRQGGNGKYPLIYIPKEVMIRLGLAVGEKVVLYVPDDERKIEIWPVKEFIRKRNEGYF